MPAVYIPRTNIPGRVETNPTGTGFKMNPRPVEAAKPGDDVPGSYPAQPTAPASPFGSPVAGPTSPRGIPQVPVAGAPGSPGGAGGNMPPPGGTGGPNLTTYAQSNPAMDQALADFRRRMGVEEGRETQVNPLLMEQVENYRKQLGQDNTDRLIDRSNSQIQDFAEGQRGAADERAARMGRARGTGYSGIDEAAQRNQAGAAANIDLAQQARRDALVLGGQGIMSAPAQEQLSREGAVTGLYAGQMGMASAPANLALAQQSQGLQQWQAQMNADLERQRMQQQAQQQYWQMMQDMMRNYY